MSQYRSPYHLLLCISALAVAKLRGASAFVPAFPTTRTNNKLRPVGALPSPSSSVCTAAASSANAPIGSRKLSSVSLFASNKKNKNECEWLAVNELSRTIAPERVLMLKTNHRDFQMNIEASPDECQALADRFDLSLLENLKARITLRPALRISGVKNENIQAEGKMSATVTQRCVRTNEDFTVDLEFNLDCLVRPMITPTSMSGSNSDEEELLRAQYGGDNGNNSKQKPKAHKKANNHNNKNVDEMDLIELQRLLQDDIADNGGDDNVLDTTMEVLQDIAVYPAGEGLMDIGELVAQLFYLQLDPYPKKPGTDLYQTSISG